MKKYLIALVVSCILSLPGYLKAEDVNLNKIVVTASRIEESSGDIGRTIDVVTSKDIEKSGSQDLADAITNLTSVDISNYGGPNATKTIRMRGSTGAQVLVLMDGRPINNPRDGEVDFSTIPLDNVSRVEVMHGPGSSLYGSSAMGGVVNIITKNPPREGQKAEIYSSFGTRRTYIERMLYGAKAPKLGFLISGGYQSSEGFRENSTLNAKDCNLKLGYDLNSENNLSLNSGFYKSRVGVPYKVSTPDLEDKQNTLNRFFDFSWNFKPDTKTTLLAKVYQNYDRLEFLDFSSGYSNKSIHGTTVRGGDLQFEKQLLDLYRLVCGFNYVKNMNDSTATAKHKYDVTAGYLQNHFDLFDKLKINLGARIDNYSNFGTQFNPNLDFLYTLNEAIKLHGLVSRSFRAPTFNDLYWPRTDYYYYGFWVGGEEGDPNLKPEKGVTEELGVETKLNKYITSGLTYYHSDYDQLIQWSDDGSGMWRPQNVSSASINGIEFENLVDISDKFGLGINYTFLMARDKKTHKYLVYQPENKIDSSLKYNDHNGLTAELKSQFTGVRFNDANNTGKVKSFFVLGLNVSKKFKSGLTYFAYIDNLLNRKYQVQSGFPMPGFSFTGGVKAEF
ncbi:MAG: TonB-dependent receptor [Candidatus Omnitrophica bacterium]|nr:TonB-dependent receptor [Candidatus Omnitrophota bacterium]